MNNIVFRSKNGEYYPGDEVTGDVFLKIMTPTGGRGVKLDIHIYEEFQYKSVNEEGYVQNDGKKFTYLDQKDVILFESEAPFSLGYYKFPFKFTIPEKAAGSFCCICVEETPAWKGLSQCVVIATVIGSESLTVSQPIVILNCNQVEYKDRYVVYPQSIVYTEKSLLVWNRNKEISITWRLLENIYRTGESLQIRFIVANNTKLDIKAFKIKLLRYLVFKYEREERGDKEKSLKMMNDMCSSESEVVKHPVTIQPEGGLCVIWEKSGLMNKNLSLMNSVLDKLYIPLKNTENLPILPSISGECIECNYQLEVVFYLNNGSQMTINHKIPCILPNKNTQWGSIILPGWTQSAVSMST